MANDQMVPTAAKPWLLFAAKVFGTVVVSAIIWPDTGPAVALVAWAGVYGYRGLRWTLRQDRREREIVKLEDVLGAEWRQM